MTQNAPEITPASDRAARFTTVSITGHFGELVQGRLGPEGPVALVTLRREQLVTTVSYRPARGTLEIDGHPNDKIRQIAERMSRGCAGPQTGGILRIERATEPGNGTGSSTADLLGTIRAIGGAFNLSLRPQEEAALCLEVEGAVDPLMYDAPVVFASREGRVIEHLNALPQVRVVGIFAGSPQRTDPFDSEFPDVTDIISGLKHAVDTNDASLLGEIATRSAALNQARNPNPAWGAMCEIARTPAAAGVVVAHTGPAIGILLPPHKDCTDVQQRVTSLGYGAAFTL